ncbi:transcriptional regulator GutM [Aneurinibacillus terranovensis]|uniref:transcriptional regulator GutM n=1 Tax=Aneurinibacillus terranovensis TaxID=278991 RepID=UPI000401A8C3|nr:transcriptional regulator GutM [Aneurinibacillus terranovensis]
MNTLLWITLGAAAWLLQYAFTLIQIRHYRSAMKELVDQYRGLDGFHLFSGISRKALGSGAIVLLIVDDDYRIHNCKVLSGISVFTRFKPFTKCEGQHVAEVLAEAYKTVKNRRARVSAKSKSLAKAFQMASENAIQVISSKKAA